MTVGRICTRGADTVAKTDSIYTAARRMSDRKVGSLVVVNWNGKPIGIVTDRDLTVRAVAEAKDPCETTVEDVMSKGVQIVSEDTSVERALEIMRSGPFRRLPVTDRDGRLIGVLSIDDIIDLLIDEFHQVGELLEREDPSTLAEV